MKNIYFILFASLFLFACEKEEKPVAPASKTALTAGLGSQYENSIYFNVLSGQFVMTVGHELWDLNFTGDPQSHAIFLNSSNFLFAKEMGAVPFETVSDTSGINPWKYDYPTGNETKTALYNLFNEDGTSTQKVFILDKGVDKKGKSNGFVKVMGVESNATFTSIRIAELDNSFDTIVSVTKNADFRQMPYELDFFTKVNAEPISNNWHLFFSQYTDFDLTAEGDTIPYLVRGALINHQQIEAGQYSGNKTFDEINKSDALNTELSNDQNAIGYRWKTFEFDSGTYVVDDTQYFILKEKSGNYYKLRFVGFYNDLGEKGYPKFEIVGL